MKSASTDITDAQGLGDFSVWNGQNSAPLSQVTEDIEVGWEWPQMRTYNRQLSMAAMCGVKAGHTMAEVHGEIRQEIESIQLPEGYTFFWDAQYKDQLISSLLLSPIGEERQCMEIRNMNVA